MDEFKNSPEELNESIEENNSLPENEEELVDEGNERFSDNDALASDLARIIKADRLFLITNVEGYLDDKNKVVKEKSV